MADPSAGPADGTTQQQDGDGDEETDDVQPPQPTPRSPADMQVSLVRSMHACTRLVDDVLPPTMPEIQCIKFIVTVH